MSIISRSLIFINYFMKDQEIEVRALVKSDDINSTRKKILETGAVSKGIRSIHDVYYCDKSCQKAEDAEMNEVGSYSVRIRREEKEGEVSISYNKKIITSKGDHNSWKEEEEPRTNFEEANQEMIDNGYKFFFDLDKNREKFNLDNMEICLEDIKNFGLGIEVEVIAAKEESEEVKRKIKDFLKSIGVQEEAIVPKSITNIIMHERAFKS